MTIETRQDNLHSKPIRFKLSACKNVLVMLITKIVELQGSAFWLKFLRKYSCIQGRISGVFLSVEYLLVGNSYIWLCIFFITPF